MKKSDFKGVSGVYALACPDTGRIRYVGRSVNILSRYYAHTSSKKNLPVNNWCRALRSKGLMPDLILLERHDRPELIEKKWISEFRADGHSDLNLHDGGSGSPFGGAGRCQECWSVEGEPGPLSLLTRALWKYQRTAGAKSVSSYWKMVWAGCKSELDRVSVCINVFQAVQNLGTDKIIFDLERWAMKAAPQINSKYPGYATLVYNDGKEETP